MAVRGTRRTEELANDSGTPRSDPEHDFGVTVAPPEGSRFGSVAEARAHERARRVSAGEPVRTPAATRPRTSPDEYFLGSESPRPDSLERPEAPEPSRRPGRRAVLAGALLLGGGFAVYKARTAPTAMITLDRHEGAVLAVAFSSDGQLLATTNDDGAARIFEAPTGKLLHTLRAATTQFGDVTGGAAFAPDGRTLATTRDDDGTIRLWDVATGTAVRVLTGHSGAVYGLAYSPDGSVLATSGTDGTIRLWDAVTGTSRRTLTARAGAVYPAVAFSPDGRSIVTSSDDGALQIWDATTGAPMRTLTGHTGGAYGVGFSPDGRTLASTSTDDTARIWDVATGETVRILTGHTGTVYGLAYSPDGTKVATTSADGTARIWDTATGATVRTLPGPSGTVFGGVAFSPDGARLAAIGGDGTARVWQI